VRINQRLKELKITQQQLANELQTNQPYLNDIIKGRQRMNVKMAVNMANTLGCSGIELLAENRGIHPLDLADPDKAGEVVKYIYHDLKGWDQEQAAELFSNLIANAPKKVAAIFINGVNEHFNKMVPKIKPEEGGDKMTTAKGKTVSPKANQEEEQPEIRQGLIDGIYQIQPATKPFSKGDLETFTTDQLIKVAHSMGWNPEQWIKNQRGEGQAQNKENMPTPPPAVSGIETEEEWRARQKQRQELHENRKERAHKEERERNLAGNEGTPEAPDIIMGNKTSTKQEMEDHYKNPEAYKKKQNKPTNNNDEGAPEPPSVVLKKPKKDGEK